MQLPHRLSAHRPGRRPCARHQRWAGLVARRPALPARRRAGARERGARDVHGGAAALRRAGRRGGCPARPRLHRGRPGGHLQHQGGRGRHRVRVPARDRLRALGLRQGQREGARPHGRPSTRIAGAENLLVVGTDHAAEAVTGFFTKFGDGGADILPLSGLTKRQGKAAAPRSLEAPARLYEKVPTADLLDDKPGQTDETELGVTYLQIDAYLAGRRDRRGDRRQDRGALPGDRAQAPHAGHPVRRLVALTRSRLTDC